MPTLMEAHLSDGALVRPLDGETDAPERANAEAHLVQCGECQARRERLERRSARLSELLSQADYLPPAPLVIESTAATDELATRRARRPSGAQPQRPWLAAAAAVVLLLGIGLAASPARAWVAGWIGERWAEAARLWVPENASASAEPTPNQAETRIDFTTTGDDFAISFSAPQRVGAIAFIISESEGASIEVHTAGAAPDVLVLPAGVRIQNAPGSTAEYRITLPAHTRRVRLQVRGAGPLWLSVEELREIGRVELGKGEE